MQPEEPTTCHICATQRATGIGFAGRTAANNKWLCAECALIIEDIRRIKRMDAYEHQALDKVDDIAGDYAAEHGTDMAEYDDLTRRMLWKTVVQGYSNALRDAIRKGAPF